MRLGEKWSSTVFLRVWIVSVISSLFLVCTSAFGQSEENFNTDPIIATGSSLDPNELYASYLFPDDGYIYVSFDSSIDGEFRDWWLEVLAFADAVIEPEFVLISADSNLSQMVIYALNGYNTSAGTPGLYSSPLTSYWSDGTITRESLATLEIAESAYSHASRFAKSDEAGWKHVAFHELGHALGLEHPHDGEDADIDTTLTTNDTVMSYLTELDADGKPNFTQLDIGALIKIYGAESNQLPTPARGSLVSDFGPFDHNESWRAPVLSMNINSGQNLMEPEESESSNLYYLSVQRSGGYIGEEATIFLDWDFHDELYWDYSLEESIPESWLDLRFKVDDFPSSIVFEAGESTVQIVLEVFRSDYADDTIEWMEVSARDQILSPGYFRELPPTIQLEINEFSAPNSTPTGSITILGTILVGNIIQASIDITDLDGLGDLQYQWYADGDELSGENKDYLDISQEYLGKKLFLRVDYVDLRGFSESFSSSETPNVESDEIKGWTWFDQYPWVYSHDQGSWLYLYPSGKKLLAYSTRYNTWRELE